MANIGKILLIFGSIATFIFIITSTGGSYWIDWDNSEKREGLWHSCKPSCVRYKYSAIPDWFRTTRAFAVMASVAVSIAMLLAILGVISEKVKSLFVSMFLFVTTLFMIIALAIYTEENSPGSGAKYGWSYILGWVGVVVGGLCGILGIFAEKF